MSRRGSSNLGPYLLHLELLRNLCPSFEEYPYRLAAVRHLDRFLFHPRVTYLVGENGTGKSTLLEALAVLCDMNPEGGSRNFNFATRASHSDLYKSLRLARSTSFPQDAYFLRSESFYNVATEIERLGITQYYGGQSLHEKSHGEAFSTLFEGRFSGRGLYLMDEPESALSPNRQLQFIALLHEYCEQGSQFVIATHSPIVMAYPHAWIYVLSEQGILKTDYDATEHFRITKAFLDNRARMLDILLSDEAP